MDEEGAAEERRFELNRLGEWIRVLKRLFRIYIVGVDYYDDVLVLFFNCCHPIHGLSPNSLAQIQI